MVLICRHLALALAALACAGAASAQQVAPRVAPQATQAAAPLQYRSVFEGYRGHAAETVLPWRESNDRVGRIGGWRSYAREAQQAAGDAPASAAAQDGSGATNHGSMNHGQMNHDAVKPGAMHHGPMHHGAAPGKQP